MSDDNKQYENEIEQEIQNLSKTSKKMLDVKETILNKLMTALDNMNLNLNGNSKDIEAKGSIINTFINLTSDIEKQQRDTLKFKSKYKQDKDLNNDISELVIGIINKLSESSKDTDLKSLINSVDNVDNSIKEKLDKKEINLSEAETSLNESKADVEKVLKEYNLDTKDLNIN